MQRFAPVLTVVIAACTGSQWAPPVDLLGDPAPLEAATKTIEITALTQHVNVTGGQIVRFQIGNRAFAWNFDGAEDISTFDLMRVAPTGLLDHSVHAYLAPNPLYMGGRRGHGHADGSGHGGSNDR